MPLTPQITVTGNLADLFGTAQPGTLILQLCGFDLFDAQLPRVSGTALIAQTAPLPIACPGGVYNFMLWGNDVITPFAENGAPQTFYTVRVVDANGNVVQINAYQFTGTQTVDLSSYPPYIPPPPLPPVPPGNTFAWSEVPTGVIDGVNDTFTLAHIPAPGISLQFYKDFTRMTAGIAFTLVGNQIVYEPAYIPQVGDTHIAGMYLYTATVPPPSGQLFVFDEVPAGTIDGFNAVFNLSEAPNPPESLQFYKNGGRLTEGIGFTLSGTEITYETDYIPGPGDTHIAGLYVY
jgi:hypothetical protein